MTTRLTSNVFPNSFRTGGLDERFQPDDREKIQFRRLSFYTVNKHPFFVLSKQRNQILYKSLSPSA
jgi:hypothetical protein